jgi:hypothetical protein
MSALIDGLKWLGLLPAAAGLLGQVLDLDSVKELDLLRGYLGAVPPTLGIVLFFVLRYVAGRWNADAQATLADKRRQTAAIAAGVLFVLCVTLWLVRVPDTFPPAIIEGRWMLATLLYLSFYGCLGLSEPPPTNS